MRNKIRLKKLKEDEEEYNLHICSVVKCSNPSEVIISISEPAFALCEKHWCMRCKESKEGE